QRAILDRIRLQADTLANELKFTENDIAKIQKEIEQKSLALQNALEPRGDEISRPFGFVGDLIWGRSPNALRAQIDDLNTQLKDLEDKRRNLQQRLKALPEPTNGPDSTLKPDQIRAAQDALALFMAQLQAVPPKADFVSKAFVEAWERMSAVMRATGATDD